MSEMKCPSCQGTGFVGWTWRMCPMNGTLIESTPCPVCAIIKERDEMIEAIRQASKIDLQKSKEIGELKYHVAVLSSYVQHTEECEWRWSVRRGDQWVRKDCTCKLSEALKACGMQPLQLQIMGDGSSFGRRFDDDSASIPEPSALPTVGGGE